MSRVIYLDYHATTPTDRRVADVVLHYLTDAFGNANSANHVYGDEADAAIATARRHIAALVGASERAVVFTSGATESINLALWGFARAQAGPLRIGVSGVEHRAVLDTCQALAEADLARLHWLRVDQLGRVDLEDIERACRHGLDVLCLMAVNNEVGTIYPLAEVAEIATRHGVALVSDATQAVGKVPMHFDNLGLTFLTFTAHKIYGPKGCGALIVAPGASLRPMIYGGGHQRGLRSGTLNVPGIAGLGEACRLRRLEMDVDEPAIAVRRDALEGFLREHIPDLVVNGDLAHRLAGNLHVGVPGVPNAAVIARVRHRVAISTGAACSSGIEAPSHVLRAMSLPEPVQEGALRISLGKFTTDDDVAIAGVLIAAAVNDVRCSLTGGSSDIGSLQPALEM